MNGKITCNLWAIVPPSLATSGYETIRLDPSGLIILAQKKILVNLQFTNRSVPSGILSDILSSILMYFIWHPQHSLWHSFCRVISAILPGILSRHSHLAGGKKQQKLFIQKQSNVANPTINYHNMTLQTSMRGKNSPEMAGI